MSADRLFMPTIFGYLHSMFGFHPGAPVVLLTLAIGALILGGCAPKTRDDTGNAGDSGADAAADSDTDADSDADTDSYTEVGFVEIPAGTFDMGSTTGQPDPYNGIHTVTLTHAYFVGATEVTQGQFEALLGYRPSYFTDCDGFGADDCPVERVSWPESVAYANALSGAAGLQECYVCSGSGTNVECDADVNPYECKGYRLLTEAEWEGAARCGTDTPYAGSDISTAVAWTIENSNDSTHAAGGLGSNACGIYDMSGNVWEWTQDWYADYPAGPATDPIGATSGSYRVVRGGSWDVDAIYATVSGRNTSGQNNSYNMVGFRLARSSP